MAELRLSFLLTFTFLSFCLTAQQDGDDLFDDSFLHEIRLYEVDTNHYITTKDYQAVNMTIDGVTVEEIGLKRKGNISGYPETNKFPMKVKTNRYVDDQEYDGIREFMLHMNHEDPSMLREKLTYDICGEMGLYSLRTAFAKVYLNDIYWGLYTIVEAKDEMYKQVFDHRDADAMESTDFGGMCYSGGELSDYFFEPGDFYIYENDNGDFDSAWERFILMLDNVNNSSDEDFLEVGGQHLNLEDFFTYQAINVYLLNMDSYIAFTGNQRYMYDTTELIWQVTPWDFNASFGLWNTNNHTVSDYPLFPGFGCVGNRVESVPAARNIYLDAMCELTTLLDTATYNQRITIFSDQIRDAVYEDTRKVVSNENFELGLGLEYQELFFENQPGLARVLHERSQLITAALAAEGYDCGTVSTSEHNGLSNELNIYPNPAGNAVTFSSSSLNTVPTPVKIVDQLGRTVYQGLLQNQGNLDISELPAGLYFGVLETEGKTLVQRFLKQ